MGPDALEEKIGVALFNRSRRELLALFFTNHERSFYLRQIVRILAMGQGAIQRELSRLTQAALITRTQVGSQVHYQANQKVAVFGDLKSLMIKTTGMAEVLRDALAGVAERIEVAFVFGSTARGEDRSNSDVDLMIIGDVSFGDVISALQPAQKKIGREVNPAVLSVQDYQNKSQSKSRFLESVLNSRRIFLIGGEHELKRLG
jgi:predicted nucleotidyltransferase